MTTTAPTKPATTPGTPQQAAAAPLKLAGNFNFTADEVKGGIDEGGAGYVDQYPFLVKLSQDEFQVVDTSTEEGKIVWAGKELPCIVFYGHSVYRLHRGTIEGVQGDFEDWTEDQKELVAQSLGSPFGDVQKSRGNFDANGYARYLDNKELRKDVSKRLYLILRLPKPVNGGELALATFGGSALKPFQNYVSQLKGLNAPLALVKTILSTRKETSQKGKSYNELTFRPLMKEDGTIATNAGNELEYREKIKPVLDKIIETHQYAMKRIEQQSGPSEKAVGQSAPRAVAAPAANAAVFDPSPGEADAVPSGAFSDDDLEI